MNVAALYPYQVIRIVLRVATFTFFEKMDYENDQMNMVLLIRGILQ
jgi:hypothetical protein